MSAAQFMAELQTDPAFVARERASEEARAARNHQIAALLEPMMAEIARAGYEASDLNDLVGRYAPLAGDVVRVLLSWLPQISDLSVKEQIVRTLGASAMPFLGTELVTAFETVDAEPFRWAVANTIAEARPLGLESWLPPALLRERYGKAREMLLIAAARLLPSAQANPLILRFLESMPLHAAKALAESGGSSELAILEERLAVTKGIEHKELERAIRKIRKRL